MSVSEAERRMTSEPSSSGDTFPPLLRQIMSSSSMVEDIEREQWVDPAGQDSRHVSSVSEDPNVSRLAPGGRGEAKRTGQQGKSGKVSPRRGRSDITDKYQGGGGEPQSVDVIQQLLASSSVASRQSKSVSPKRSAEPEQMPLPLGGELLTPAALEQKSSALSSLSDVVCGFSSTLSHWYPSTCFSFVRNAILNPNPFSVQLRQCEVLSPYHNTTQRDTPVIMCLSVCTSVCLCVRLSVAPSVHVLILIQHKFKVVYSKIF